MRKCFFSFLTTLVFVPSLLMAQQITNDYKVVTTAVPFMTLSPDSRAAAMGDAGAASSPDAASMYWNTAKLAFIDNKFGANISYAPWLSSIVNDMGLLSAQSYYKISENQTVGAALTYFDQGQIQFTSASGDLLENFHSKEFNLALGIASKLGNNFSAGVNLKFINSNLVGSTVVNGLAGKPARTAAFDISFYRTRNTPGEQKRVSMDYGLVLQNLGGKVNYGFNQYYIPANLKVGTKFTVQPDNVNQFNLLLDFNKLLVPTPVGNNPVVSSKSIFSTMFTSFCDAPGGFKEEMAEVMTSVGAEYNYASLIALRTGYFYESGDKGARQYVTAGVGLNLKKTYKLDLAYLIPTNSGNPLANTWRLTLNYNLQNLAE
jgi:Type IX secretion system protein PorV